MQNVGEEQHHRLATGLVDLLAVKQVEEKFPEQKNPPAWQKCRGKKNIIPMNSPFLMVCGCTRGLFMFSKKQTSRHPDIPTSRHPDIDSSWLIRGCTHGLFMFGGFEPWAAE
jgi:hypothetical protein